MFCCLQGESSPYISVVLVACCSLPSASAVHCRTVRAEIRASKSPMGCFWRCPGAGPAKQQYPVCCTVSVTVTGYDILEQVGLVDVNGGLYPPSRPVTPVDPRLVGPLRPGFVPDNRVRSTRGALRLPATAFQGDSAQVLVACANSRHPWKPSLNCLISKVPCIASEGIVLEEASLRSLGWGFTRYVLINVTSVEMTSCHPPVILREGCSAEARPTEVTT